MTYSIRPAIPAPLAHALTLPFKDEQGEGFDFEPRPVFLSVEETRQWLHSWTGNDELTGQEYLVFGRDGTGGFAAIWLVREDAGLMDQPVVFFGFEGADGVVSRNVYEFLWRLACGVGPQELIEYGTFVPTAANILQPFRDLARIHAARYEISAEDARDAADAEFPSFLDDVQALCRY